MAFYVGLMIALAGGVLGLEAVRGPLRAWFPRVSTFVLDALVVVLLVVGGIVSVVDRWSSDSETENLKQAHADLKSYLAASKLGIQGTSGTASPPLEEHTELSGILGNCITVESGRVRHGCEEACLASYRSAAAVDPTFPFAFYLLAVCRRSGGDAGWRDDANRAIQIFEKTITISGHNPQHDQALKHLTDLLSERDPPPVSP